MMSISFDNLYVGDDDVVNYVDYYDYDNDYLKEMIVTMICRYSKDITNENNNIDNKS